VLDCVPSELQLFRRSVSDLESFVLGQDVVYVGGGNTASLLAVWRAHGLDRVLRRAWEEGIVLCGVSAGMNCWFEQSVTDSFDPAKLAALDDGAALVFEGEELAEAVGSRFEAGAYRIERSESGLSEERLPVRLLGESPGSRP
jgi:dipeptidase E